MGAGASPGVDSDSFAPVRQLIAAAITEGAFPGAAWGVSHHGRVVATGADGGFTYDPASPRVTPETVYDLASVTKVVATTAAAMLLVQRGSLDLDSRLGDLLPGFVIASDRGPGSIPARHSVTLRALLAHASGLPGYAPLFLKHRNATDLFRACLHLPLIAVPGQRAEYSDIGFILLGKAIELLSGLPLDQYCAREIFRPLGMAHTRYRPDAGEYGSIPPTELDQTFRHRTIQGQVHDENCWVLGGCAGHAGLFAPVADLLLFAEAILAPLRAGPPGQPQGLFTAETVRLFTTRAGLPADSSRALGWDTPSGSPSSSGHHFSTHSVGHLGYTGTSLWLDLERDLAVVLLSNRSWPTRENKRIQTVRPAVHDAILELLL